MFRVWRCEGKVVRVMTDESEHLQYSILRYQHRVRYVDFLFVVVV